MEFTNHLLYEYINCIITNDASWSSWAMQWSWFCLRNIFFTVYTLLLCSRRRRLLFYSLFAAAEFYPTLRHSLWDFLLRSVICTGRLVMWSTWLALCAQEHSIAGSYYSLTHCRSSPCRYNAHSGLFIPAWSGTLESTHFCCPQYVFLIYRPALGLPSLYRRTLENTSSCPFFDWFILLIGASCSPVLN